MLRFVFLAITVLASLPALAGDLLTPVAPAAVERADDRIVMLRYEGWKAASKGDGTLNSEALVCLAPTDEPQAKARPGELRPAIAIDSTKADEEINVLRLDFSGKGKFKNAPTVTIKLPRKDQSWYIGLAKIEIPSKSAKIPATVHVEVSPSIGDSSMRTTVFVRILTGLEANVKVGDSQLRVTITSERNGTYKNKIDIDFDKRIVMGGDFVTVVDERSRQQHLYYGQLYQSGDKWYRMLIDGTGKELQVCEEQIKTAKVKFPGARIYKFLSEDFLLFGKDKQGDDPVVELPPGKYIAQWSFIGKFEDGTATVEVDNVVKAVAGQTTEVKSGLPISGVCEVEVVPLRQPSTLLTMKFKDAAGNRITGINGIKQSIPGGRYKILNSKGQVEQEGNFQGYTPTAQWRGRDKGTYVVKCFFSYMGTEIKIPDQKFKIK